MVLLYGERVPITFKYAAGFTKKYAQLHIFRAPYYRDKNGAPIRPDTGEMYHFFTLIVLLYL